MKDNFFLKSELLGSALVFTYVGRIGRDIISIYSWGGCPRFALQKSFL